jgi:Zn-dependent protease
MLIGRQTRRLVGKPAQRRVIEMRDPMSWALPVFRAFGIQVKVHIFFFIVTLGMVLRQKQLWPALDWLDIFLFMVVVVFGVVLIHEFGHCFGARYVEGEAKEVLIWPLGGLAFVDVPHTPRANFIATVAGPAMNVVICFVCAVFMALAGYLPSLNPLADPYSANMANFDGRTYTSSYGLKVYKTGTKEDVTDLHVSELADGIEKKVYERTLAPTWAVWLFRIFWLSWVVFLFNLLPAYPLDGGRMLQCAVWARTDHRRGVVVAAYSGFVVSIIFLVISISQNQTLLMGLALFMMYSASLALHQLEMDDGPFGYDFSAGYTSLEKDEEKPKKPKQVGWFTRWRQARRTRRLQLEAEERQRDEERMDQLLEKIARTGKESLTDEEKRFLERVSARKRNMS